MIKKFPLLIVMCSILFTGCNNKGTNIDEINPSNSDTNSIESSWISSNKDTVLARVNASEDIVCGPSYKLFDKKMTISSVYATKSEEIEIDKPNNKEISDVVRTSTYSYNPDNLAFNFTYDTHYLDDDSHSIRTLNITVGQLDGQTVLQTQHRYNQFETFDFDNVVLNKNANKKDVLEKEIDNWLFYIGLNVSFYFNHLYDYLEKPQADDGYTLKTSNCDTKYFIKGNDGIRITSKANMEEYANKTNSNNQREEYSITSDFDLIIMDNMIQKYDALDKSTFTDCSDGKIYNDEIKTTFSTVYDSSIEKIDLLK